MGLPGGPLCLSMWDINTMAGATTAVWDHEVTLIRMENSKLGLSALDCLSPDFLHDRKN